MFSNCKLSLATLLGDPAMMAVVRAGSIFGGDFARRSELAHTMVECAPADWIGGQKDLLHRVGTCVCEAAATGTWSGGAPTGAFAQAHCPAAAPLAADGLFRVGEDGRLYLTAKSEHYQLSLGHQFPGMQLLELADRLGISNMTHNNTRGMITRRLERELVRVVNGIAPYEEWLVDDILNCSNPFTLNRVINLETGSLAMEAALKMMLARFYRLTAESELPLYHDRVPVFLVIGDYKGTWEANYHGTTIGTQLLRGLWPDAAAKLAAENIYRIVPVAINDIDDFAAKMERYNQGEFKVAGFFHEIVLMNYGAICLEQPYLQQCYQLCRDHDVPVAVDEIQSCMWSPDIFMFREYGLCPDFVSVGKGLTGGYYPASRLITNQRMDNLNLFGALVTNGQEEIASLAGLITLRMAEINSGNTRMQGDRFGTGLERLRQRYSNTICAIDGAGLMRSMVFADAEVAADFAAIMNRRMAVDTGCQTYKADCPPTALFKLPLITSAEAIDWILARIEAALTQMVSG